MYMSDANHIQVNGNLHLFWIKDKIASIIKLQKSLTSFSVKTEQNKKKKNNLIRNAPTICIYSFQFRILFLIDIFPFKSLTTHPPPANVYTVAGWLLLFYWHDTGDPSQVVSVSKSCQRYKQWTLCLRQNLHTL